MLPENIIYIGVVVGLVSIFLYIKNIFFGTTRPNLVSWTLWLLGPFLGVFFQLKAGAGLSVLPVFMAGFGPLLVVIFSIFRKNSYWKLSTFDIFCGIFSILALVLYALTHNLAVSIIFAILSDLLAFVPTYIKGWKFPESETSSVYITGLFNNILGLLIIKNWSFTIYSFGLYLIIANIVMIYFLYRKKIF
ncbi:hypothetical protein A2738_01800 [Candidatus Nomurabacteria bacterium RIFCSPHIGHO2_01_FULL_42_15]|uniref:Uncharacterized protein n=1 Tax=Candidatus Nomurabacteria bacterium RIFCSPHIGHO2_01_FULL_42_15 TaxID=1801742 RepID=A0A1F6VG61_9BACT|nr:MAG: hypothetical protein A2738_01800 [Candidatus Nomurabacteria bacterium RIFCSPHIGHO2_01_FULL_42_15]OGI92980.1 MAG: hypothetical protein A3A99_00370 [Candidatus Nomurabacteria bacterium RIFCSPLOWO2_01_FULL_41_18]